LSSGTLGTISRIGLIGIPIEGWKFGLMLGERAYINGNSSRSRLVRWENRLGIQRDWDMRISYEKQIAHELLVGISTYW
jgi:hypothetical protein